ncbi:hypothetical protein GGS23DRAFT_545052 [Durotheca rogersii]|uniref:uncharacterized protein n=1 Tax=Durotheca rogersii TaxID=419775 RepID=UPI00221FB3DA|nr:uncharacterized protein GGS23DRAFT_545052 [Durotheca rogersii]KAI5868353.1 hypothetical protein GGS23DRAFT_545052 [Durotheca rogersii]
MLAGLAGLLLYCCRAVRLVLLHSTYTERTPRPPPSFNPLPPPMRNTPYIHIQPYTPSNHSRLISQHAKTSSLVVHLWTPS